jgi:hypothetical protein
MNTSRSKRNLESQSPNEGEWKTVSPKTKFCKRLSSSV